jgi:hypothetical protein
VCSFFALCARDSHDQYAPSHTQFNDSVYVYPLVRHRFVIGEDAADFDANATLYMVRLPGAMTESVIREYANYKSSEPGQGRHRVGQENVCWYATEADAVRKAAGQ